MNRKEKAFTSLFEAENGAIFRFCLWRVSDRELAVELTQEAFARLWREMARGKDIPNPRAFLFLVAKRLIIDWYRKGKTLSLDKEFEGEEEPMLEARDDKASADMETNSDARRALDSIEKIDERYRDVVYLRFVEDLPPREIASILKLSPNAVSVRLTRGIAQLREILGIKNNE